jgi:hypothetical protein
MTSDQLIASIHQLIFEWQKCGLILDSRNHQGYQRANGIIEVTWGNDGYVLKDNSFASLDEYCSLIESRQYSMLLSDGSMLQISYKLDRQDIVGHRLCWYPSPIDLDEEAYSYRIIDNILDRMASGDTSSFRARGPLRFDFAPEQAHEEHPETHLHLGHEECRIPVKSSLSIKSFMTFIVENFYPDVLANNSLHSNCADWFTGDSLTEKQRFKHHLNILHRV